MTKITGTSVSSSPLYKALVFHWYRGAIFFDGIHDDMQAALEQADKLQQEEAKSKEKAKRTYGIDTVAYYPSKLSEVIQSET